MSRSKDFDAILKAELGRYKRTAKNVPLELEDWKKLELMAKVRKLTADEESSEESGDDLSSVPDDALLTE